MGNAAFAQLARTPAETEEEGTMVMPEDTITASPPGQGAGPVVNEDNIAAPGEGVGPVVDEDNIAAPGHAET